MSNTKISDATKTTPLATDIIPLARVGSSAALSTRFQDISVVGTITTGTWNGTTIATSYGGTGATTAAGARTNLGLGGAAVLNVGTTAGTVAAGDDSRFTFTPAGTGAVSRSLQEKLRDAVSVADFGADPTGVASASPAIAALIAAGATSWQIGPGVYNLGSTVSVPAVAAVQIDPAATFTGSGKLNMASAIKFQGSNVASLDLLSRKFLAGEYTGFTNVFTSGVFAEAQITVPVVAVFGSGYGSGVGSRVWGGNFVAYADADSSTAIGMEIDCGVLATGAAAGTALAYGCLVASAGNGPVQSAYTANANNAASQFIDGYRLSYRSWGGFTRNLFYAAGYSGGGSVAQNGLYLSGIAFSSAEILTPSFRVDATPASPDARLTVSSDGSTVCTVGISADTATNVALLLTSLGTSYLDLRTGGGANRAIRVNDVASAVNYIVIKGAVTGDNVSMSATGSDTDVGLTLSTAGAGSMVFRTGSGADKAMQISATADAINYLVIKGGATGGSVSLVATGGDAAVNLLVQAFGTGAVRVGSATNKVGFYNSAGVVLPAAAAQAALAWSSVTDGSGGTAAQTTGVGAIGASYSQSVVANAFATLTKQVNDLSTLVTAMRNALIPTTGVGLIKGSN